MFYLILIYLTVGMLLGLFYVVGVVKKFKSFGGRPRYSIMILFFVLCLMLWPLFIPAYLNK